MRAQYFVRCALTLGLLAMTYRETGPWTVAVLALISVSLELQAMRKKNAAG